MALQLSKKVHFLQLCPDLSKKTKFLKEIYMYDFTYRIYEFTDLDFLLRSAQIAKNGLFLDNLRTLTQERN